MSEIFETIQIMRKNLGPVTAYKYAVQQGYTGTEQEFAALMASYATVADTATQAADNAVDAKTAAEAAQAAAEAAAEQAEGAIEVDNTLSVEGRAADAKKTGDEITGLKGEFSEDIIAQYNQSFTIVENSEVKSTTGVISDSTEHSRSDYTELKECESVTLGGTSVWYINCCFYDKNKVYITGYAFSGGSTFNRPVNAKYIIFTAHKNNIANAVLTLNKVPSFVSKIYNELNTKISITTYGNINYINEKTLLQNVVGVSKFPNNLIINEECLDNAYVDYVSGYITSNQSNYFCTGYIPVTAGQTYRSNLGRNYAWYDSNKTYISGAIGISIQNGITAPTNAAYIRFTVNKTTDGISSPIYLYFADTQYYDDAVTIQGLVVTEVKPWCYGQKINWIGDSIVDGADFDEVVCSALGLVKNSEYGIDGSTIALKADGTDGRHALCERYGDMSNDADIIAVSCGTNDFEYAWCPIGTINDADDGTSNTTFYGALKALCKGLIDKYPQKLIFFTTPIKRGQAFGSGNGGEYTVDGVPTTPFSKNKYGKTLMDYADIIKEVCGYYSIPVLDMYRESLLNPHIASQQGMFDNVLTHPNVTGQKIMARRICGWLTQLGYIME